MRSALVRDLKTTRFWRNAITNGFAGFGALAALAGLVSIFTPKSLTDHTAFVVSAIIVASICYGLVRAWPRPIEQYYSSLNTKIRVLEGDLFAQDTNLVVGVSDTFDTETPNIIDTNSVLGQFLSRIYGSDRQRLDRNISEVLDTLTPIGAVSKDGKTQRYAIGTVVPVRQAALTHFLLAFTVMSEHNNAHGTADGVWQSLSSLWASISRHGNARPIAIPVLGGGLSRLAAVLPAQDSIRFIIFSYILASRVTRVSERLDIIVRPDDFKHLDRLEIQAFLRSLRPS